MKHHLWINFILAATFVFWGAGSLKAQADSANNPVASTQLGSARAAAGGALAVTLSGDGVKIEDAVPTITVSKGGPVGESDIHILKNDVNEVDLSLVMPAVTPAPYSLDLGIPITVGIVSSTGKPVVTSFRVFVTDPDRVFFWSAGFTLLALFLALYFSAVYKKGKNQTKKLDWGALTLEESGRSYSLSRLQALIWTVVTVFCIVYVWLLTGITINLNSTMLSLLGISAASGMLSQFWQKAPEPPSASDPQGQPAPQVPAPANGPVLANLPAPPSLKTPSRSDFFCEGGQPNLYRVQLFIFTIVLAVMILQTAITQYDFMPLDDNYLALMGISNGAYIWDKSLPNAKVQS